MSDERIALENIEEAREAVGRGGAQDDRGTVGLIASYGKAVKVTFKEPIDVQLFVVAVKCRFPYNSIEDPDGFLKAIGKAPAEERAPAKAA